MGSKVSASIDVEYNILALDIHILLFHCGMSFLKIIRFVSYLKLLFLS